MNDLNKALGDIRSIRRQMAHTTEFRGFGPLTLGATGLIAIIAAFVQSAWVQNAAIHTARFILLWAATAVLSAALIAIQTLTRSHRMHSGMANEMIHQAVTQFLPAAIAGALVSYVFGRYAYGTLWLLPALWQIIYSLGIFASCRFLPRPMLAAGAWYLATGLLTVTLNGNRALSPWLLGGIFGFGQALMAVILFVTAKESAQ